MTPALKPMDEERKVVLVVISKLRIRKHDRNIMSTQMMLAPITQAVDVVSMHTTFLFLIRTSIFNEENAPIPATPLITQPRLSFASSPILADDMRGGVKRRVGGSSGGRRNGGVTEIRGMSQADLVRRMM